MSPIFEIKTIMATYLIEDYKFDEPIKVTVQESHQLLSRSASFTEGAYVLEKLAKLYCIHLMQKRGSITE